MSISRDVKIFALINVCLTNLNDLLFHGQYQLPWRENFFQLHIISKYRDINQISVQELLFLFSEMHIVGAFFSYLY